MADRNHHLSQQGKPEHGRKTLVRLLSYITGRDRRLLFIAAALLLVSICASTAGSYMVRPIINNYIIPGDWNGLIWILVALLAVYLIDGVSDLIQFRMMNGIGLRAVARLREHLFSRMDHLPVDYFDTHQTGDLMSRYTNDMDRISDALTDSLSNMISGILTLVGITVMMLIISPLLTVVMLVMVPLMLVTANWIVRRSRRYFSEQQASLGDLNGYTEEMISGAKVVKVFNHEKATEHTFGTKNRRLNDKSEHAQFYSGLMMPTMQSLNVLSYVLVTIAGGFLAIFRGLDVGGLAAFLQYSRQFGRPINDMATLYNSIQAAIAGAERIFDVIDEAPEPADAPDAVELDANAQGEIVLSNVVFGYVKGRVIIDGISFRAAPDHKIALVGTTGAGKTTILSLLPRFYDIWSGEITIDGRPVGGIKRDSLRRSMAIVLQDTHLFTGTVRENIRFGRLTASDEEVEAAARLTAAHSFIKRLPKGYDTLLENDGANLSAGQRQLLNIARAAVADPPILLLDEATSNIDTRSEMQIQRGLDKLMEGRTSLIIAHRLSTVMHADTILVLENGRIIERGNHNELLASGGKYAAMYKEQFE